MGHLGCGYGLNEWGSYDEVSCCFVGNMLQKIAGLQGSTLSDHRMTTGFVNQMQTIIHSLFFYSCKKQPSMNWIRLLTGEFVVVQQSTQNEGVKNMLEKDIKE